MFLPHAFGGTIPLLFQTQIFTYLFNSSCENFLKTVQLFKARIPPTQSSILVSSKFILLVDGAWKLMPLTTPRQNVTTPYLHSPQSIDKVGGGGKLMVKCLPCKHEDLSLRCHNLHLKEKPAQQCVLAIPAHPWQMKKAETGKFP